MPHGDSHNSSNNRHRKLCLHPRRRLHRQPRLIPHRRSPSRLRHHRRLRHRIPLRAWHSGRRCLRPHRLLLRRQSKTCFFSLAYFGSPFISSMLGHYYATDFWFFVCVAFLWYFVPLSLTLWKWLLNYTGHHIQIVLHCKLLPSQGLWLCFS